METSSICPQISDGISAQKFGDGNVTVFVKQTKKSYVIGEKEYKLLLSMDGRTAPVELSKQSGCYSESQIETLVGIFRKLGLVDIPSPERKKRHLVRVGVLWFKLGLCDGNRLLRADSRTVKLLSILILVAGPCIFVTGIIRLAVALAYFPAFTASELLEIPALIYIAIFFVITALHELGHAIVARSLHVPVPEIGVMFYTVLPLVYTDMSFSRLLPRRSDRMKCLFGGICTNLLVGGLPLLFCSIGTPASIFRLLCSNALINSLLVLANIVVFFKLDGYFILQDLLEIPYFYENSTSYLPKAVNNLLSRTVFMRKKQSGLRISRVKPGVHYLPVGEKFISPLLLGIFGLLCSLYFPFLLCSLILAVI